MVWRRDITSIASLDKKVLLLYSDDSAVLLDKTVLLVCSDDSVALLDKKVLLFDSDDSVASLDKTGPFVLGKRCHTTYKEMTTQILVVQGGVLELQSSFSSMLLARISSRPSTGNI